MQAIKKSFSHFRKQPAFTGFVLFLAAILLNVVIQGPKSFFSVQNMNTLFATNIPFLLVVMSQAILLITGTLDISCGIQLALVNVVTIMTVQVWGIPFLAGCVLGICAAMIASLVCWFCVSVLRLPALLASFALVYAIKGVNVLIMRVPQGKVSSVYYKAYDSQIFGFIPASCLAIVIVLLIWYYVSHTRFGVNIYAVGTSQRNAFAAGINTKKVELEAFLLKGLLVGIAGICLTLMTASGNPIQAEDYGIRSLAACIIGGLSFGGWGSMACGVYGGGFLILIQNAVYYFFNLLYKIIPGFSVTSYWHNFVSDIIIFLGLLMTIITAKEQRKALKIVVKNIDTKHKKGGGN